MSGSKEKELMLEVLEDTIKFYSEDTNRRSREIVGGVNFCTYENKENGNKCAVGRLLNKQDLAMIENKAYKDLSIYSVYDYLTTEKVKSLPVKFWSRLQEFHDNDSNWSLKGLTFIGKQRTDEIRHEIELL